MALDWRARPATHHLMACEMTSFEVSRSSRSRIVLQMLRAGRAGKYRTDARAQPLARWRRLQARPTGPRTPCTADRGRSAMSAEWRGSQRLPERSALSPPPQRWLGSLAAPWNGSGRNETQLAKVPMRSSMQPHPGLRKRCIAHRQVDDSQESSSCVASPPRPRRSVNHPLPRYCNDPSLPYSRSGSIDS